VAKEFNAALLDEGIYVIVVFFPVMTKIKACICVQLSAAQTCAHLEKAIAIF
jgi:7-keto-8-aminopelargonate synthetase-like enzyme